MQTFNQKIQLLLSGAFLFVTHTDTNKLFVYFAAPLVHAVHHPVVHASPVLAHGHPVLVH